MGLLSILNTWVGQTFLEIVGGLEREKNLAMDSSSRPVHHLQLVFMKLFGKHYALVLRN